MIGVHLEYLNNSENSHSSVLTQKGLLHELNHTNVSVWAAGGQLRSGLWSVLCDEAPHLWGRGQCQINKMQTVRTHLLLSGDNKHDSAAEPKLPCHLQRRWHLRLPSQEAIRQHLPDQVSYITIIPATFILREHLMDHLREHLREHLGEFNRVL